MQRTPMQINYGENPTKWWQWARLRFECLFLSWAMMEMALIAPLALVLFPWTTAFPTGQLAAGVLICMLLPFYLTRGLTWAYVPRRRQRQILAGTAVFVLILAIRHFSYDSTSILDTRWTGQIFGNFATANNKTWQHSLGVFVIITIAWWRGITLVSHYVVTSRSFGFRLRHNSLVYLPIIVVLATLRQEWAILPFITLYFVCSPIAMILTRVEEAEREHGAILSSISPRWLSIVALNSLILSLLTTGTAVFVSGSWEKIIDAFGSLWLGLQLSLAATIFTLAYPGGTILRAI